MILSVFLVLVVVSIIALSLIIKFKEDPFSFLYSFRKTYSKKNPTKEYGVEVYDVIVPRIKSPNPKSVIRGWFIPYVPKEGESGVIPTIIATHGFSQNRDYLLPLIENFQKNKCHCIMYDGHSHGASSDVGVVSGRKFSQDIQSIVDFVCSGLAGQIPDNRTALIDSNVIGLVGFSLGAVGSLHAASVDKRIRFVAALAPFADYDTALHRDWKKQFPKPIADFIMWVIRKTISFRLFDYSPMNTIKSIPDTVFITHLHGTADRAVPVDDMEILESVYKERLGEERVHTRVVDGAKHLNLYSKPESQDAIDSLLQSVKEEFGK
eukprot:TRINITY_DN1406_c0_g1_i1.p1 TRINITY_DN1406_c0_g1~~TRINITY_DN1406_c0_g1_i1.p1  ORF type:complete len:322 (-),score=55.36 TRINITY_DN1406_c0_g1_i1:133-1098(-)